MKKEFPKRTVAAVAALVSMTLAAGCTTQAPEASGTDANDGCATQSLQFALAAGPTDINTKSVRRFADLVTESTDGSLSIRVFDSGSLYDQNQGQTALLNGTLDMTYTAPNWVAERVPSVSILSVPYLIDSVDHLYAVMDSEVGDEIAEDMISKAGIRPIAAQYLGTRQLNLRGDDHINDPSDLSGVRLRVPDAPAWVKMGQALGATPSPIAFNELYLALQTGTVDGQDNPYPASSNGGFYEVTDQIVKTAHLVDFQWATINEKRWDTLCDAQQTAVEEAWKTARDEATQETLEQEKSLEAEFEAAGLTVYEPDREAFRDHVLPQYIDDSTYSGAWTAGHLERIRELAAK